MAQSRKRTLIDLSVLALVVIVGAWMGYDRYVTVRAADEKGVCAHNLKLIESLKEQWTMSHHQFGPPADPPPLPDLVKFGKSERVELPSTCPLGGAYTVGDMMTRPSCSVHGVLGT